VLYETELGDLARVGSFETGDLHVGDPAGHRAVDILEKHSYNGCLRRDFQFAALRPHPFADYLE